MKMKTRMAGLVLAFLTVIFSPALGQMAGSSERETDWQAYFTTGYFDAGTVLNTTVEGERVEVDMDEGWLFGVRVGADQEYLGVEALIAGVISGSYPALYLSAFRPVSVLKGTLISGKKGTFVRKCLVVLQFSLSVIQLFRSRELSEKKDT